VLTGVPYNLCESFRPTDGLDVMSDIAVQRARSRLAEQRSPMTRLVGTGVQAVMFDGEDEAKENEIIAAVVAVLLAGAITFIVWAIVGQG
jgi:hypothetical protein